MQNIAIDEIEIRLPNKKENKNCYYSCIVFGPAQYDANQEICPILIAITKQKDKKDLKPL